MKLSQKFNMRAMNPMPGGLSGIWMSVQATEVATAIATGTGPGVADDTGTPQAGTITPGQIVVVNAQATLDLASSPDLTAGVPILPFVVFSGDDDFSGSLVGDLLICHGGTRFDTEKYDGITYNPGDWLIASATTPGNVAPKVVGDHKQIIAQVGPRGLQNGVLDVVMFQGVCSYAG